MQQKNRIIPDFYIRLLLTRQRSREEQGGAGRSREEQGGAGRSREEQGGAGRSREEQEGWT